MNEDRFFDEVAKMLDARFLDLKTWIQNSSYTKTDHAIIKTKIPKGGYKIADKGCNKCGGKITWDKYDKEEHPYPDHVDEDGNLTDCPEYKPEV